MAYKSLLFLGLISAAAAQTWSSCNPMNETDCPNDTALGMNYTFNFVTTTGEDVWNTTAGTIDFGSTGAEFTINQKGDSPTIQSEFYIFGGKVEVNMKAAPGQGIISSIVLESDDLDEVDWEFIGGNHTTVETNYFGKGNTTSYDRAIYYDVDEPQSKFHNYTVDWTQEAIKWIIDGTTVRTLKYADANNGNNFPQTPMNIRLGIWAGGDSDNSNGTIEWAGGLTSYDDSYTMYVKSCKVWDYSTGKAYKFGDKTGSWDSIEIISGNSTVKEELTGSVTKTVKKTWHSLSKNTRIAIGCSAAGGAALLMALFAFCCIKQRRAGRKEAALHDAEMEKGAAELMEYRSRMANGGYAMVGGQQSSRFSR
ncbi:MAG: hypothetical protein M1834_001183 [Cirrosporium novae-zelandiae]|nr:MAG: hypothetical protein M1834_001183 [Cirrosporium novae-zelandiae]